MNITFIPLAESHFPLLLKWLESPNVKIWWDRCVEWTPTLIQQKYSSYVKGYKLENGVAKTISAHIISVDNTLIGYVQIYNAYDFTRNKSLTGLPRSLAAFDVFIGEAAYLKHGIGSRAIAQFLKEYGNSYTHVFADPENTNLAAIKTYEKAGFKKINKQPDLAAIWMIRENITKIIYLIGKPGTGKYTIAQELAKAGFIVCDNQLINNPIFTLLNYDGFSNIPETGWNAIGHIRTAVFDFISIEQNNNYVLTNCLYENEGDHQCYSQVASMAGKRGSLFVPVKLLISEEENLKRIVQPSRRARWKSIDPQDVSKAELLITIEHPHLLELDVSPWSATQVAEKILEHIQILSLFFNNEKEE